jgi:opacity protein-like surface antigen
MIKSMRLYATLLIIGISLSAVAQTTKGSLLLGGQTSLNLDFSKTKWKSDLGSGDDSKSTSFEFSPELGYFVIDNMAIGVSLPINYSTMTDSDDDKMTRSSFVFAPFLKYYFGDSMMKPFLNGSIGFGKGSMKYDLGSGFSDSYSMTMFAYQVGAGLGVFLNEKVSLDLGLRWSSTSTIQVEANPNNSKTTSSGLGFGIGVFVVL